MHEGDGLDPVGRRIARLQSGAAKCESSDRLNRRGMPSVAIAGSRAAWLQLTGGNNLETISFTGTLARPKPVWLAYGAAADGIAGSFVRRPVGDECFSPSPRRTAATLTTAMAARPVANQAPSPKRLCGGWEARAAVRVRFLSPSPVSCSVVARADSELTVLAVDAGRIAVRTRTRVRMYTAAGRVLRDIDIKPVAAVALSGNRLVVRDNDGFVIYDARTGKYDSSLFALEGKRLEDLERGIVVIAEGGTVGLGDSPRAAAGRA